MVVEEEQALSEGDQGSPGSGLRDGSEIVGRHGRLQQVRRDGLVCGMETTDDTLDRSSPGGEMVEGEAHPFGGHVVDRIGAVKIRKSDGSGDGRVRRENPGTGREPIEVA